MIIKNVSFSSISAEHLICTLRKSCERYSACWHVNVLSKQASNYYIFAMLILYIFCNSALNNNLRPVCFFFSTNGSRSPLRLTESLPVLVTGAYMLNCQAGGFKSFLSLFSQRTERNKIIKLRPVLSLLTVKFGSFTLNSFGTRSLNGDDLYAK